MINNVLKYKFIQCLAVCGILAMSLICGCSSSKESNYSSKPLEEEKNLIVVGFSQLGAESDWRSANTKSMKDTFTEENGYELIFEDGQQKQSNQFTAIRSFIQQEVDYIVLAPVTETGWDTVLQEAKDANIPVIIVDRMVDVSDENLFTCWVGSNFELEGKKAAEWLHEYCGKNHISDSSLHIVDIQGTLGASAQIGRTKGLEYTAEKYGWDILDMVEGEFTQTKGRQSMDELLRKYNNINVVYCENDNEAIGVLESLDEAGITAGSNIKEGEVMVLSFDGVNETAVNNALEGKISAIAECNPLHGPRVKSIIEKIEAGENPEKYDYVDESIMTAYTGINKISVDGAYYEVSILKK